MLTTLGIISAGCVPVYSTSTVTISGCNGCTYTTATRYVDTTCGTGSYDANYSSPGCATNDFVGYDDVLQGYTTQICTYRRYTITQNSCTGIQTTSSSYTTYTLPQPCLQ